MKEMTRIKESTRITQRNVHVFLRRFAKKIPLQDLELIPRPYGGDSIVFYYGNDKMLKVPKNGHRTALTKETKLSEYLNTQQLPVTFVEPLLVHSKGFYAVFSRINGRSLTSERLEGFTPNELESFARSLGTFLSFLHTHKFPNDVMEHIPRPSEDLKADLRRARRKIQFIKECAPGVDTSQFEENLERLQGSLDQVWAITHSDLSLNHVLSVQESAERLAIIDFAGAQICDPSIDFSELAFDLSEEGGLQPDNILEMILKHYRTDDQAIAEKIEFRLLTYEIHSAYKEVRDSATS